MIGDNIKALRMYAGMTQIELADELGTFQSRVALYEANKQKVPIEVLKKLKLIFGVPYEYIIDQPSKKIRDAFPGTFEK